jgi:hypothetical protein
VEHGNRLGHIAHGIGDPPDVADVRDALLIDLTVMHAFRDLLKLAYSILAHTLSLRT